MKKNIPRLIEKKIKNFSEKRGKSALESTLYSEGITIFPQETGKPLLQVHIPVEEKEDKDGQTESIKPDGKAVHRHCREAAGD